MAMSGYGGSGITGQIRDGIGKFLAPLGIAVAIQLVQEHFFPKSSTSVPPPRDESTFNFVHQPGSSMMSKFLSLFSTQPSTELSSPDIPPPSTTFSQPVVFANSNRFDVQTTLPRRIPAGPIRGLSEPGPGIPHIPPPSVPSFSSIGREETAEFEGRPVQEELSGQTFLQTLGEASHNLFTSSRPPSVIAHAVHDIDGGLMENAEKAIEYSGTRSPLRGLQVNGMTKTLLNNIGNLVHARPELPSELPSEKSPGVPLSDNSVTHNVFDDHTTPLIQRTLDHLDNFKLPEVHGVPFDPSPGH